MIFFLKIKYFNNIVEKQNLQKSILTFSSKIFGQKTLEVIDNDESFRKLNMKNISLNKSALTKELELEAYNEKNKNTDLVSEDLTEEIIDTLDTENLKSILKRKCKIILNLEQKNEFLSKKFTKLLNEEKEKNDELSTLINLQKKEIQGNNKFIIELKKEVANYRDKANSSKTSELSQIRKNNMSYYFMTKEKKEEDMQMNDLKDIKRLENQFSGDSDVSFSSKIDNNDISKKWFSDEKNISITFDQLEIKFKKNDGLMKGKTNIWPKKEFKVIDVDIYNLSTSTLLLKNFDLDSTESKILIFY